jgi:hypothetical protein
VLNDLSIQDVDRRVEIQIRAARRSGWAVVRVKVLVQQAPPTASRSYLRIGQQMEPEDSANRYWEGRWRDEKADNERLRAGIQDFLDGDFEPRIKKTEKCKHGAYGYESCEACIEEHFTKILALQQSVTEEK